MSATAPDTNLFIHSIVHGTYEQYQNADAYFGLRGEVEYYILDKVKEEFEARINSRAAQLRQFARLAEQHGDWEAAKDGVSRTDNFTKSLVKFGDPETAHRDLTRLQRNWRMTFDRKIGFMKEGSDMAVEPELANTIIDSMPTKDHEDGREGDDEVIGQALHTSYEAATNLILVSDDANVTDADYDTINAAYADMLDGDTFKYTVSGKQPDSFVNYVKQGQD